MKLETLGGLAGLFCAATYMFGFAFLFTRLAPLGYGTMDVDGNAVMDMIGTNPTLPILWNTVIYILNALALVVLVMALDERLRSVTPEWSAIARAFGLIWSTLVLGAGMIANLAIERAAHIAPFDIDRAGLLWETLHAVELGLGGGNEVVGAVWMACVSVAGKIGNGLGKPAIWLGLVTGLCGALTLIPDYGDFAGILFGVGAFGWFIAVGFDLALKRGRVEIQTPRTTR